MMDPGFTKVQCDVESDASLNLHGLVYYIDSKLDNGAMAVIEKKPAETT